MAVADYYNKAYDAKIKAIDASKDLAKQQYDQSKETAQQTQARTNKGLYQAYMQQINPFASNVARGLGGRVSDYAKNQAFATYTSGVGDAQNTYDNAMNMAENTWQSYLTQDAQQRASAEAEKYSQLAALEAANSGGSGGGSRRRGGSSSSSDFYDFDGFDDGSGAGYLTQLHRQYRADWKAGNTKQSWANYLKQYK